MGNSGEAIVFWATINKVQTLVDNGLRVALDLSELAVNEAALLIELKRRGAILKVEIREEVDS